MGKDEERYPKTQALTRNPHAGWVQTEFSKPIALGIYMLKRNIPVLVEETKVATQRTSCVRRNSSGESGVSPCQLHAPTRASALACFQRPTQTQIFVTVWPLPRATAGYRLQPRLEPVGHRGGDSVGELPTGSKW